MPYWNVDPSCNHTKLAKLLRTETTCRDVHAVCMQRFSRSACLKVREVLQILCVHWLGRKVFHLAGSKDEGFYFRSKRTIPEHKAQGNQVNMRVGKTAESSSPWWIPLPAELVRDPSKKTVPALLVSCQYIRTMDTLSGMLLWAGCLF